MIIYPAIIYGQTNQTNTVQQADPALNPQKASQIQQDQKTAPLPEPTDPKAELSPDPKGEKSEPLPDPKNQKTEPSETPEEMQAEISYPDPLEKMNRFTYGLNKCLDCLFLKPVAVAYAFVIPTPVKMMVRNVFQNLSEFPNIINDILQGNFCDARHDAARLIINTTWGIGGLFDPASKGGLETHSQDFGLTMAHWGYPNNTVYLVVPLFGPSTLRDTMGRIATYFMTPQAYLGSYCFHHHHIRAAWAWQLALIALKNIDSRGALLKVEPIISDAVDEYTLVKDAYFQNRQYQINGGSAVTNTQKAILVGPPE